MLAPLAGISDLPFRRLNRSFGCRFAFPEMISARALLFESGQTLKMLTTAADDRPLGLQLLGNDGDILRQALDALRDYDFEIVNLNAACPVDKVTRKAEGAGLLKDPRRLRDLLRTMVEHSPVPVTVKIRSGWDGTSVNAREVALHARDAGIEGLFIHGRTREQRYAGEVDYGVIRSVKEALDIPVIASGDALSPQLIKKMFENTGCDGVIIARGALGNPWIFREAEALLTKGEIFPRPDRREITDTMVVHLAMCCNFYGEATGVVLFRKFFAWYTRSLRGARPLREKAFRAGTKEEMLANIRALDTLEAAG